MTQFQVLARRVAFAGAVACVFASALSVWPSLGEARKAKAAPQAAGPAGPGAGPAQGAEDNSAQKVAETEAAKKAYDAGLKGFAAGKYKPAIEQLTIAVQSGKLSPAELSKALLTRGRAYKKDNQAGLAISDLTSAMWLKNGLSPSDQKSAMEERADAYRMAGLADTGSDPSKRVIGTPTAAAPAANVTANAAPGPNAGSAGLSAAAIAETASSQKAEPSSDGTAASVTHTAVNGETTLQSAASASVNGQQAPPASSGGIAGFFGWGQSSAPAPTAPVSSPAPAPAEASTGSSFTQSVTAIPGNVSGFFSNMFGGGSSQPAPQASQGVGVTTASTAAVAPETSSWSSATSVGSHAAQRDSFRAEKASYSNEAPASTAVLTKGKFKIHIAALRSKAAADALAQKLIAEHGPELGNHMPVVDSAVIGSMGTFYRVRIGGYASQTEPRSLCNKLRTSGLDCLVVTN